MTVPQHPFERPRPPAGASNPDTLQDALLAVYREYPAEVTRILELTLDGQQLLVKIKAENKPDA